MSLFDKLGKQPAPTQQQPTPEQLQQMQQSVRDVKANPAGYLHDNFGVNIPQGSNNPMQILQHLAQSGQLNQQQMQMYQRFGGLMGAGRR